MSRTLYIPDLVKEIVDKVNTVFATRDTNPFNVYYDFGHHQEVQKNLTIKEESISKPGKYPLVWLVTPFNENHEIGNSKVYCTCDLHFVIAFDTEPEYTMQERRDKVFLPILYPVCQELLRRIYRSSSFICQDIPKHTKMDLQYARVNDKGENLFNDFVDVIDLKIQSIQVRSIC